jgi:hypothetical protein
MKLHDIDTSAQVTPKHEKYSFDSEPRHRGVWIPDPWVSVRPGADDHLRHGSRRGDTIVQHRGPIAMTGSVEPIGYHRA